MIPTITFSSEEIIGAGNALLRAVTDGRPRQVRLLLDAGAHVDQADDCGQTALIKALFVETPRSRLKIVHILLRSGATVSRCDVVGRNALSWACYYGRDKAVEMLIRHRDVDLDLNMSDINGCTPLFHAATSGNAACVKNVIDILCKYALSVDVPNFNGITPLMQALRLGHDVCASILFHQGKASTTVRDSNFLSAMDWAARVRGRTDQKSTSKKLGFLPVIQVPTSTPRTTKSNKPHDLSDGDNDSSYDSSSDWIELIAQSDADSSCCSSKSGTTRNSPDITFGRTPINSPKPGDIYATDDEESDYLSERFLTTDSEPHKSEVQKTTDLPQLYSMLSDQLSKTYRSPESFVSRPDTPLDAIHGEDCPLECCNSSRASTPMSSRSLPSIIRVPEERIQSMVAARRIKSMTALDTAGKKSGTGFSLRKRLAQKQLQARQASNGSEENKEGFPSLPETGRISLVSSANDFIRSTRTKDTERIFSGKGFRL